MSAGPSKLLVVRGRLCKLGAKGLEQVIEITLTTEERIALQKSAAAVPELVSILGI
jgi:malate dehydrogenase